MAHLCKGLSVLSSLKEDIVLPTEVLDPEDERARSIQMTRAKQKEVRDLLKRGTFKIILKEAVSSNANVFSGRLLLAIRSDLDGRIKHKARYVMGGQRDKWKELMVHKSKTLSPQSARLLLASWV